MTTTLTPTPMIDESALEAFLGQAVTDAAAAVSVLLAHLGDRLGLYAGDGRLATGYRRGSREAHQH